MDTTQTQIKLKLRVAFLISVGLSIYIEQRAKIRQTNPVTRRIFKLHFDILSHNYVSYSSGFHWDAAGQIKLLNSWILFVCDMDLVLRPDNISSTAMLSFPNGWSCLVTSERTGSCTAKIMHFFGFLSLLSLIYWYVLSIINYLTSELYGLGLTVFSVYCLGAL